VTHAGASTIALPDVEGAVALVAGLFAAILVLVTIGRRLGAGRDTHGLEAVERAVFGLMALLMAFTFSSAAIRFEARRSMLVEEANAVRTTFMRLDLLPAEAQPELRAAMRRYVDARIEVYRDLNDAAAAESDVTHVAALQRELWEQAVAACRDAGSQAASLVLPALNAMFTVANTRTVGLQTHQHFAVFAMLAVVMLACALLAGFSMGGSTGWSWLHVVCFAAVLTVSFYVILDLEYPRLGIIRIDWMDRFLREAVRSL
jgi:hypothetical protein